MASVLKGQAGQPIQFETKPKVNGEDVALENQVIGVGQTWQNVTASRSSGVTYTNNTGKPIVVSLWGITQTGQAAPRMSVGGLLEVVSNHIDQGGVTVLRYSLVTIVPDGDTYSLNFAGIDLIRWNELR